MRNYLIFIIIVFLISGCAREKLYQKTLYVFGTLVEVSLWGSDEKTANSAIDSLAADFQRQHRQWHAWQPSDLTELNQAFTQNRSYTVNNRELLSLISESKIFYTQSEGLFNPAIGQLIELWGFHRDELSPMIPPTSDQIGALTRLAPNMNDVDIQGNVVYSRNSAVQLDFGAIAKGYAVDLAIEKLRKMGINNAIVNAGGNLKAIGKHGNRPWQIGIRHPDGEGVLAGVTISNEESVVTSGNYERYFEYVGKKYAHIIDPRTGMPASNFVSVTVIDPSATRADAASTALAVADVNNWHKIAKQMGIRYVLLMSGQGEIEMNPEMAKRVKFSSRENFKITISKPLIINTQSHIE